MGTDVAAARGGGGEPPGRTSIIARSPAVSWATALSSLCRFTIHPSLPTSNLGVRVVGICFVFFKKRARNVLENADLCVVLAPPVGNKQWREGAAGAAGGVHAGTPPHPSQPPPTSPTNAGYPTGWKVPATSGGVDGHRWLCGVLTRTNRIFFGFWIALPGGGHMSSYAPSASLEAACRGQNCIAASPPTPRPQTSLPPPTTLRSDSAPHFSTPPGRTPGLPAGLHAGDPRGGARGSAGGPNPAARG